MCQKKKLLMLFKRNQTVTKVLAEHKGVKSFRQQVYFLRKDGYKIINTGKQTYKML